MAQAAAKTAEGQNDTGYALLAPALGMMALALAAPLALLALRPGARGARVY